MDTPRPLWVGSAACTGFYGVRLPLGFANEEAITGGFAGNFSVGSLHFELAIAFSGVCSPSLEVEV